MAPADLLDQDEEQPQTRETIKNKGGSPGLQAGGVGF